MNFDIGKLGSLSRILLGDEEKGSLAKDLENILAYVEQINELDEKLERENVPVTNNGYEIENVFRPDTVGEANTAAEDILKVLPDSSKDGRFFRVPKIIESIE